jgi:nitroreductase
MMDVAEAVASRRSIRAFLDTPVSLETITRVLDQARMAPSGCNYQPWEATVLTGEPLRALQEVLLAAAPDQPPEYDFMAPSHHEEYSARLSALGAKMYGSMNVGRADVDGRGDIARQNLTSFGAPILLLCHFPKFMEAAQWSDVGMWLQTVMLLLRGEGLDSCPQEWMGLYGRTILPELGHSAVDTVLFCGIAIGYRDPDSPINRFARERVPLAEQVRFVGF